MEEGGVVIDTLPAILDGVEDPRTIIWTIIISVQVSKDRIYVVLFSQNIGYCSVKIIFREGI